MDYAAKYSADSWLRSWKWTILEIIPPREIEKGPQLMESIFSGFAGVITTYSTFDTYIKGAFMERFSIELVGEEGKVHFYIRTMKKYRNLVESHVYSKYPDAEILEVPDYTAKFPKIIPNRDWTLWGCDFEFQNPDPIPIKTYDRFEESVTGEMIDPMATLIEVMGALGPGQHIWLQFILSPLNEKWNIDKGQKKVLEKLKGTLAESKGGILADIGDVLSNVFKGLFGPVEFKAAEKKDLGPLEFRLSPGEKEVLKATEENLGRNSFTTKMRFLFISHRERFEKPFVSAFIGAIKQFNDANFNQMKPENVSKTYASDKFLAKSRLAFRQRKIYRRYRDRDMDGKKIVLSNKELATVYHFPDMGVKSAAITRTESKLGSAPPNLPVE